MARLRTTLSGSIAFLAVIAGTAFAAERATNISADVDPDNAAIAAVQNMAMAQRLAGYGAEIGDAVILIAAARIANQVAVTESSITPRESNPDAAADSPGMHTAGEMLAAARALAGDRADLIALIDDAEAEGSRGSVYGAGYYDGYIQGGTNVYYDEAFYGGEQAVITLEGHDPSDIDLWVYDEYGNQVCSSTSYSSYESCSFVPRWTGNFTIRVENEGHPQGTYYTVWTN